MPENQEPTFVTSEAIAPSEETAYTLTEDMRLIQRQINDVVARARRLGLDVGYVIGGYDPISGKTANSWGLCGNKYAVRDLLLTARSEM